MSVRNSIALFIATLLPSYKEMHTVSCKWCMENVWWTEKPITTWSSDGLLFSSTWAQNVTKSPAVRTCPCARFYFVVLSQVNSGKLNAFPAMKRFQACTVVWADTAFEWPLSSQGRVVASSCKHKHFHLLCRLKLFMPAVTNNRGHSTSLVLTLAALVVSLPSFKHPLVAATSLATWCSNEGVPFLPACGSRWSDQHALQCAASTPSATCISYLFGPTRPARAGCSPGKVVLQHAHWYLRHLPKVGSRWWAESDALAG